MHVALYAIWCAGIALKALAALSMARSTLIRRYPTLWVFLILSVLRSTTLAALRSNWDLYRAVYSLTMPLMLLAEGFAITGVFWVMTENYPRFRRFGSIMLSVLAILGALVAWWTRYIGLPPVIGLREVALMCQRYVSIAMAAVLVGTRVFLPRSRYVPIRRSAQRAAYILTLDALFGMIAAGFALAAGGRYLTVTTFMPVCGGIILGALWAFCFTPASDCDVPFQPLSPEELDRRRRASQLESHSLLAEIRDAIRQRE